MARNFRDLSEREILALAISLEEEDSRIYGEFADGLRERYPSSASMFDQMQHEETLHHSRLVDIYKQRFGDAHPAAPPPGRERLRRAAAGLARPAARPRDRPQAGGNDGARDAPVLRARDSTDDRCIGATAARRAGGDRARALRAGDDARRGAADAGRARRRRQRAAAAVRAADRAAGPRRADGRLGLDAGAAVRRGGRHAKHARRVHRRARRVDWRGDFDGVRRGAVRRRLADWPGTSLDPRAGVRTDDDGGRTWSYRARFSFRSTASR